MKETTMIPKDFSVAVKDIKLAILQARARAARVPNISYHLRRIYEDAELDKSSVIKEILITGPDGKNYSVKHYNIQVIAALGSRSTTKRPFCLPQVGQPDRV